MKTRNLRKLKSIIAKMVVLNKVLIENELLKMKIKNLKEQKQV